MKKTVKHSFGSRTVKGALMLLAGLSVCFGSAHAQSIESLPVLLQTVPIDVTGYAESKDMDNKLTDATCALGFMNESSNLMVHMEAIRRLNNTVGQNPTEKQKFLEALKKRYMADQNNPSKFFDYGYAQLVLEQNKNGLFFLRKANDRLGQPATSLAYGLAQIDADRLLENVSPETLSTRKMDAGYKLKDALLYNKEDLKPGVWPTYVHIVQSLKDYPAFDSLRTEDVSVYYVPYGNMSLSYAGPTANQFLAVDLKDQSSTSDTAHLTALASTTSTQPTCSIAPVDFDTSQPMADKPLRSLDGHQYDLKFFQPKGKSPYDVVVYDENKNVLGHFLSSKATYLGEDLDQDGKYELVVRQYDVDPLHPVYVYRWNGSCFGEDKKVTRYFQ